MDRWACILDVRCNPNRRNRTGLQNSEKSMEKFNYRSYEFFFTVKNLDVL